MAEVCAPTERGRFASHMFPFLFGRFVPVVRMAVQSLSAAGSGAVHNLEPKGPTSVPLRFNEIEGGNDRAPAAVRQDVVVPDLRYTCP
jgi:hypothetical protein